MAGLGVYCFAARESRTEACAGRSLSHLQLVTFSALV